MSSASLGGLLSSAAGDVCYHDTTTVLGPWGLQESSTAAAGAPARLLKQQDNPRGSSAFEKAPNCTSPPTANTSTADETSHLWGWNSERDESCAFKDSNGDVIWYPDYEPASWLHTPACNSPPFGNESVVDSNLKVTGLHHSVACICMQDALSTGAAMACSGTVKRPQAELANAQRKKNYV